MGKILIETDLYNIRSMKSDLVEVLWVWNKNTLLSIYQHQVHVIPGYFIQCTWAIDWEIHSNDYKDWETRDSLLKLVLISCLKTSKMIMKVFRMAQMTSTLRTGTDWSPLCIHLSHNCILFTSVMIRVQQPSMLNDHLPGVCFILQDVLLSISMCKFQTIVISFLLSIFYGLFNSRVFFPLNQFTHLSLVFPTDGFFKKKVSSYTCETTASALLHKSQD
jgi:hypothetical protein